MSAHSESTSQHWQELVPVIPLHFTAGPLTEVGGGVNSRDFLVVHLSWIQSWMSFLHWLNTLLTCVRMLLETLFCSQCKHGVSLNVHVNSSVWLHKRKNRVFCFSQGSLQSRFKYQKEYLQEKFFRGSYLVVCLTQVWLLLTRAANFPWKPGCNRDKYSYFIFWVAILLRELEEEEDL